MAEIYLIRHAQAAFGTDDYDRLTELGHRQSRWLGEYFAERGTHFDRVVTGTLRRHRETLGGISKALAGLPETLALEGLNEYRADVLIAAHLGEGGLARVDRNADRRAHFGVLREALYAWVDGVLQTGEHAPFDAFSAGVREGLAAARAPGAERVLVVSSGGPISTLIGTVLGLAPRTMMELNLQARNTGVTELRAGAKNIHCVSFNNVPHLDRPERRDAITYS
jgi:broad specificity phosphatase PhoE